jgi:hypothetical protein
MSVAPADSYARARLLELLGIERVVPRGATTATGAPATGIPVGGASAPTARTHGRSATPSGPRPLLQNVGVACGAQDAERFAPFIRHLARAIGVDPSAFTRRTSAPHTICFGTAPPDGPATLAPPLSALRASPQAKRAFWRTLRDLRRARH